MAVTKPKSTNIRIRISPEQKKRFLKGADVLDVDVSTFLRLAGDEKIERMRAEGKKL
jgi:hypothetical protein